MKNFRKNIILTILFGSLLFFILRFSAQAKQFAYLGLSVWFEQMIPSLLPFMILSSMLIRLNLDVLLVKPVSWLLKGIYQISDTGSYVLFIGFLCGFPMGAKTAAMEYEQGKLSEKEAEFLLAFTNNFGPAYFLSFVYGNIYHQIPVWHGLFFLYGIPLLYGMLLRMSVYRKLPHTVSLPQKQAKAEKISFSAFLLVLDESINTGLYQIAMLGGYMIVCNLLVIIPRIIFSSSPTVCSFFHNLLEISGGLISIQKLQLTDKTAFIFAHLSLAFTGVSCHLQTFHILGKSGLSGQKYMLHKLILCSITGIFLCLYAIGGFGVK